MINLDSTSDKLQLVTSGATAIDVHVSHVDRDPTAAGATELAPVFTPPSVPTAITTATTTDILGAPGASIQRNAKYISACNKDAAVSNTLTFQHVTGAGTFRLFKCTLAAGEAVICRDGSWLVYDATGNIKTSPGTTVAAYTVDPHIQDFRLTGVTATPVMTADSTALSTIYCTPYRGQRMALYDGAAWQLAVSAEVSLAVTGRTTDLPVDVFAYLVGSTVTLEFLDWTNSTTRATALVRQDGIWCKTGALTRRYLGTFRPRSATTFHWVTVGTDLPCKFDLFNADNRVDFPFMLKALSPATWVYTTATIRQAQASANYQVDVMVGLQEENFVGSLMVSSANSTISIGRAIGIGYDSTTTFTGENAGTINTVASIQSEQHAQISHQPAIGRHVYSWNETSVATGACTWTGSGVVAGFNQQSGMRGLWTC